MSRQQRPGNKHRSGHTLVELLVALTIGLVISLAVAALYSSTNASKQAFDDVTVLRDSARAALQLMGEQIRTAGYGLLDPTGKNVFQGSARTGQAAADTYGFPIFGCSTGFSTDPPGTACASSGNSPAFSVAYQAEAGSDLRDCEGNQGSDLGASGYVRTGFTAPADSKLVMSSFRLSGQQLQCQGSGASWQVIVDNVVSFTVEYGVDTDNNTSGQPTDVARSVNEWSAAGPSISADWANVVAVRLCIVLQSAPGAGVSNTSYTNCSGANTNGADNRVYQRLTSTVQIRNIRPAVS
ncbi:MAG: PilW family protein [Curvibacter sp.]